MAPFRPAAVRVRGGDASVASPLVRAPWAPAGARVTEGAAET